MEILKPKRLLCVSIIFFLFCAVNVSAKPPLPEFFGVYALYNGQLIELQPHPQGQYAISGMTVMGADVISQLSGISFPEGTIEFIIFQHSAATFNKIPLSKIARIDVEANTSWGGDGTKRTLKNRYHLMPEEIYMNVAPLKDMMVRVVPKSPLSPGIWAIKIGSKLYDFVVGSEESAGCVIRKVGAIGVEYIPCSREQKVGDDGGRKRESSVSKVSSNPRAGHLFIKARPVDATIKILNIGPKFYQGIELKPGRYHVEVSAEGYRTVQTWIKLDAGAENYLGLNLVKGSSGPEDSAPDSSKATLDKFP